jgi:hypothetical protein
MSWSEMARYSLWSPATFTDDAKRAAIVRAMDTSLPALDDTPAVTTKRRKGKESKAIVTSDDDTEDDGDEGVAGPAESAAETHRVMRCIAYVLADSLMGYAVKTMGEKACTFEQALEFMEKRTLKE